MIYSIVIALSLVLLSVFPPYLGFLYSGKIIEEFKKRGLFKGLIIFGISGSLISTVFSQLPLVFIYFSIYGTMILCYFIFEKTNLKKWDKAFIITIISFIFIFLIYYANQDFFKLLKESMNNSIWDAVAKLDKSMPQKEVMEILKNFYDKLLSYLMIFVFLSNVLTYVILDKKTWEKSEFSYIFLLGYIFSFLFVKYSGTENYILNNLAESIKYAYILYGLKEFFVKIKNKSKLKFFSIGVTVLLYSIQPFIFFVYGGLKSFKLTKKED